MMKNSDREVEDIVRVYGRMTLKERLERTHRKMLRARRWKGLLLLLGAIAMIVMIALLLKPSKMDSKQEIPIAEAQALFREYFEPYPIPQVRSGDSVQVTQWDQVVNSYQSGLFAESMTELERGAQQNSPLQLCLSSAYLATDNSQAADSLLTVLSNSNLYRNDAIWYRALLKLKQGQIDETKQLLYQIQDSPGYQEKVATLLTALE